MTNDYQEQRFNDRAFEMARLGVFVPENPALESRNGGADFAGALHITRNTLRATWEVLAVALRSNRSDGF
jgi:hypothetical protein